MPYVTDRLLQPKAIQKYMPDRERLVIVVNAPEWWRTVWAFFKPFLPEKQQERLRVCQSKEDALSAFGCSGRNFQLSGNQNPAKPKHILLLGDARVWELLKMGA